MKTKIMAAIVAFAPLSVCAVVERGMGNPSHLGRCNEAGERTRAAQAKFKSAMEQGRISGPELDKYNALLKRVAANAGAALNDRPAPGECRKLESEADSLRAEAERYLSSGLATATVTPAHLTLRGGASAKFAVACSSGKPAVAFSPRVGPVTPSGDGGFTVRVETNTIGTSTGTITCGKMAVAARMQVTVAP